VQGSFHDGRCQEDGDILEFLHDADIDSGPRTRKP